MKKWAFFLVSLLLLSVISPFTQTVRASEEPLPPDPAPAEIDAASPAIVREGYVTIDVNKKWEDALLPHAAVTVRLLSNGVDTGKTLELSEANDWQASFIDLLRYDDQGAEIAYTVAEDSVLGYDSAVTMSMAAEEEHWVMVREPESLESGREYVIAAMDWGMMQSGVDTVYQFLTGAADGELVALTRQENTDQLFFGQHSGHTPLSLGGKEYIEYLNPESDFFSGTLGDNLRWVLEPVDTNWKLYNTGSANYMTLVGDNNYPWQHLYSFQMGAQTGWNAAEERNYQNHLSIYPALDGQMHITGIQQWGSPWGLIYDPLQYLYLDLTIFYQRTGATPEIPFAGMFKFFTPITQVRYTATVDNTITRTSVEGAKTWDDDNDGAGKRPTSLTVKLMKGTEEIARQTVTAADGWAWRFEDLPMYENGTEIVYSLEEIPVAGYKPPVYSGYDITNSLIPTPPPAPAPSYPTVRVPLRAQKVLINGKLNGGDFTFELRDINGKVVAEARNAADGTITFPDRTFSKAVTDWTYTIREVKGSDENMQYDSTVYKVKVTTRAAGGKLEATVNIEKDGIPYAGAMTFTNTRHLPKTGDNITLILGFLMGMSALLALGAYLVKRKEKTAV